MAMPPDGKEILLDKKGLVFDVRLRVKPLFNIFC